MDRLDVNEPPHHLTDATELLVGYLDYYRSVIARKISGLDDAELRRSRVPSGWSPLELVNHLVYMERRWLRWGFAAESVDEPWGDQAAGERWTVPADATAAGVVDALHRGGERTREIVAGAELSEFGATGGRFGSERDRPSLAWILFHVLQEYARHAGHLDIVRELADGSVGE